MMRSRKSLPLLAAAVVTATLLLSVAPAQDKKDDKKKDDKKDFFDKKGGFGGPPMGEIRKVLAKYDVDKNGRLDAAERKVAREALEKERKGGGFGFGKGGPGGGKMGSKSKAGEKVKVEDAKTYPKAKLFDTSVLRTFFLEFENDDWESEMAAFYHTDIEVPATLVVDGKRYRDVGVHFRGMSSYFTVGASWKRSLNVSMDFVNKEQRLYGHRTVNLLNSHDDDSFLHTVLFSEIARTFIPTPRANFAKVVINGENWGVYVSQEQFNKDMLAEQFGTRKGDRWKVKGSPGGRGGLEYLGDDVATYKRIYTLKSAESDAAWKGLVNLCKVLNTTPPEKLEEALRPILDVEGALRFLALDCALVNMDGYWVRASDYSIYRDPKGKFHVVPHDMNETFSAGGGFGFGGKMGGGPPDKEKGKGKDKGKGGPGGFFQPGRMLVKPVLDGADKDEDGKLTRAETTAAVKALYKLCEADKKGEVSQEALEKVLDKILPRPKGFGDFRPPSPAPMLAKAVIERAGKDGKVTEAALVAEAEKLFAKADKDKDGKLDEDELADGLSELMPAPKFGGPGFGFGGAGGVKLDPLVGLTDKSKPLRSKLLAVPALKERYLRHVKTIAEDRLDWKKLGPKVAQYRKLIEKEVEADTKKLYSLEAFRRATADEAAKDARGGSLRGFADERRRFLLDHAEIKKLK